MISFDPHVFFSSTIIQSAYVRKTDG